MKIYILKSDSEKYIDLEYSSVAYSDVGISADYDSFLGESISNKWIAPNLVKSKQDYYKNEKNERMKLMVPDIYGADKEALFSEKAKDILESYIDKYGEFLIANSNIGTVYYYNTLLVLDALDYQNSKFEYWDDGKTRIRDIVVHQFDKNLVKDLIIFKLKDFEQICIYVTDKFKDIIEQNELKAFIFEEVWDSENVNKFEEINENDKKINKEEIRKNNIDRHKIVNETELLELISDEDWESFIIEYVEYLESKMLLQNKSDNTINVESMNLVNQVIYSVYSYYFEITNGGFNGYIINMEGEQQVESIEKYLDIINAKENIKLINEVFEYVNQLDTGNLKDIYDLVQILNNEEMEKFNSRYEKLLKKENIYDLLVLYINSNLDTIKENLTKQII